MTDQKQSTEQNQSSSGFLTGVILGGIVGAAVALLTSPKNGREVRTYLDEKTSTSRERLTVKSKEMREKAEPVVGEWIKVASDKAAPVLNIVKDKAREAAELKQQIDEDELSIEEAMEKADQLVAEAESEVKEQMDRAAEEEKPSNASDSESESDDSLEAPVNELLDEESKEELEDLKKDLKKNE
ncbi:YtxH domain-containing protein [Exiguobacterium profundum]|uniref:YtxH domain-containing protein n=1 Tax=Exiguobacterium profundum TaxID=307643 RepID=UPI002AA71246|nr:YtxH domain-containing protein [Exiguobacterium profundum]